MVLSITFLGFPWPKIYDLRMFKTVAQNRRARFDYAIGDTVEAGIMLTGQEAKSCREGHVNLSGS